jgi:hypothetical protein
LARSRTLRPKLIVNDLTGWLKYGNVELKTALVVVWDRPIQGMLVHTFISGGAVAQ